MKKAKVINDDSGLKVVLPLTQPTGKVRVKERSFFGDYGSPVSVRKKHLGLTNYVEWQIGYDLEAKNANRGKTSLQASSFINYKGKRKYAYELSEILYYANERGLISQFEIQQIYDKIKNVDADQTFEELEEMNICRTNPIETSVNGMKFYKMTVKYPMLVHKFGQYDIYAEVIIREKQRAVGTQAMLYVCLPITTLQFKRNAIGRALDAKETGVWPIGQDEAKLALELFRVFGMLSPKHRFDVLAILKMLFPNIEG